MAKRSAVTALWKFASVTGRDQWHVMAAIGSAVRGNDNWKIRICRAALLGESAGRLQVRFVLQSVRFSLPPIQNPLLSRERFLAAIHSRRPGRRPVRHGLSSGRFKRV
jgi:hypothetical protein